MDLTTLADRILSGERLTEEEGLTLLRVTGRDIWKVADAADRVRRRGWGTPLPMSATRTST